MDTLEYLKKELSRLGAEANELAEERLCLDHKCQEINTKLTHLAGAMSEIDKMIKSLTKGEK